MTPYAHRRDTTVALRMGGVLLGAGTALAVHAAGPDRYRLDPVHTRVLFAVSHAGFSQALGTVSGSEGELWFDPADWRSAGVDVRIPMARIDLGDAKWNAAVTGSGLLDVARFPQARFVSRSVEPRADGRLDICGDVTLHGSTRPLCFDAAFNQARRHPLPPFRRTAGFSATATLSRSAFGVDAWRSLIGDQVTLRIEAEAVRVAAAGGRGGDAASSASTATSGNMP